MNKSPTKLQEGAIDVAVLSKLTDIESFGAYGSEELLELVASAEKGSEHPLGEAIGTDT